MGSDRTAANPIATNRLAGETSPYLLQHKDNPVNWWPWGPEALAEARRTGKPILLSVGYAACHWCHVMAHESFEDPATAEVMNGLFINIKVDREERPDIDAIYMGALHRLGEQGGWPLTMFLDSEARPFWGGTYFPKEARFGRPSFVTVLLRLAEAYQNQPDEVASNAAKIVASLEREGTSAPAAWVDDAQIADLITRLADAFDPVHGGLKGAPKFPQWNVLWLLWRGAVRFNDARARDAVILTLKRICAGGIYDHLGGGFARYSVDEEWLVPHFEKMLYDNALLVDLLTEVWRETQEPVFARRIEETVAWLEREMIAGNGAFSASLDADSEGEEGKFYVWSLAEIEAVLGAEDGQRFAHAYDVTADGNFEGANILNRLGRGGADQDSPADDPSLAVMRDKLLAVRAKRIRPGTDDKVLADWNGLMIAALARASTVFGKLAWRQRAETAFAAIVDTMSIGEHRLMHSWRDGKRNAPATASDYANMSFAAIRLFEATSDARYIDQAASWASVLEHHYWDGKAGGYFTAADDTTDVIVRLKSAADDAVPNANAIQFWNLLALSALTSNTRYEATAETLLAAFASQVTSRPVGHCGIMAMSLDAGRLIQIVSIEGDGDASRVRATTQTLSVPGALEIALTTGGGTAAIDRTSLPVGLRGKIDAQDSPAVYVCQGATCLPPLSEQSKIREILQSARQSEAVHASE